MLLYHDNPSQLENISLILDGLVYYVSWAVHGTRCLFVATVHKGQYLCTWRLQSLLLSLSPYHFKYCFQHCYLMVEASEMSPLIFFFCTSNLIFSYLGVCKIFYSFLSFEIQISQQEVPKYWFHFINASCFSIETLPCRFNALFSLGKIL